jgi:hypothetical protein
MNKWHLAGITLFMIANAALAAAEITTDTLDNLSVCQPAAAGGKLPVVFFAHNGGAAKEDWGDFPAELAASGFVTVNIGWTNGGISTDIGEAVTRAVDKYADRIDTTRAFFIGGCHGGIKIMGSVKTKLPVTLRGLAFLSMSERIAFPETHVPMLGIYSLRDHLGKNYISIQKAVYEKMMNEPKKVIALDAAPHGNELVTDAATKDQVRGELRSWLAALL